MPRPHLPWFRADEGRRGRRALLALGALTVLTAASASSGPTTAADDDDSAAVAEVRVDLGLGGRISDPGDPLLVRVSVAANELIDGSIRVSSNSTAVVVEQPLQVPAGTTKEVLLLAPAPVDGPAEIAVLDGDTIAARRTQRVDAQTDVENVGLLAQLASRLGDPPDTRPLAMGSGRAAFFDVPGDVLDLGAAALRAYDTIIGAADDLTTLSAHQRESLLVWVGTGGRLLLDDAQSLDALPAAWRPGQGATYALAGLGEVRLLDGAASAGRWDTFLQPSGTRYELANQAQGMWLDPESSLARRAGLELPDLMPLIVGLLIYGFVVGPLVYLVLRRRRRLTLAWIVIPTVAVVVAAGIVVVGGRLRDSGHPVTASFVSGTPAGAAVVENVLVLGRSGGERTLALPAGWTSASAGSFFVDGTGQATLVPGGDGAQWRRRLDPGQVATTSLVGQQGPIGLALTAQLVEGQIEGTITNETGAELTDIRVFAGDQWTDVAALPDGTEAEFTLPAPVAVQPWNDAAAGAWPVPWDGQDHPASNVDWGVLSTAGAALEELFPTGLVRAVGWSTTTSADVDPGDGAAHVRAWSTTVPVDPNGAPPDAATIRTTVVRTPMTAGSDIVVRYLLPPGAAPQDMVLRLPDAGAPGAAQGLRLSAWDGEEWIRLDDAAAVPADLIVDGVVLVKMAGDFVDPSLIPTLTSEDGAAG